MLKLKLQVNNYQMIKRLATACKSSLEECSAIGLDFEAIPKDDKNSNDLKSEKTSIFRRLINECLIGMIEYKETVDRCVEDRANESEQRSALFAKLNEARNTVLEILNTSTSPGIPSNVSEGHAPQLHSAWVKPCY